MTTVVVVTAALVALALIVVAVVRARAAPRPGSLVVVGRRVGRRPLTRSSSYRPYEGEIMTKPADTPFPHTGECKTPDARPEWHERGRGVWQRICGCHTEVRYPKPGSRPDPLDPRIMRHAPGCDVADSPEIVRRVVTLKVESSYTFASCTVCAANWYAFDPPPGRDVAAEIEAANRTEARQREEREAKRAAQDLKARTDRLRRKLGGR